MNTASCRTPKATPICGCGDRFGAPGAMLATRGLTRRCHAPLLLLPRSRALRPRASRPVPLAHLGRAPQRCRPASTSTCRSASRRSPACRGRTRYPPQQQARQSRNDGAPRSRGTASPWGRGRRRSPGRASWAWRRASYIATGLQRERGGAVTSAAYRRGISLARCGRVPGRARAPAPPFPAWRRTACSVNRTAAALGACTARRRLRGRASESGASSGPRRPGACCQHAHAPVPTRGAGGGGPRTRTPNAGRSIPGANRPGC